jgi:hypothetical protein
MKEHTTSMPEGLTVKECLIYIEKAINPVYRQTARKDRAGESMSAQEIKNASILTGRSITAIRRLKIMFGYSDGARKAIATMKRATLEEAGL